MFDTFGKQMIEEIEMLCASNKIRKHSQETTQAARKESLEHHQAGQDAVQAEIDEERLCNICCFMEKDTVIVPCGHMTCFKCIQVHTQNSEKCPYCNVVITEMKRQTPQ